MIEEKEIPFCIAFELASLADIMSEQSEWIEYSKLEMLWELIPNGCAKTLWWELTLLLTFFSEKPTSVNF